MAIVGGVPWISYYQSSNTGQTAQVYSSSWDGVSTWNAGTIGLSGGGSLFQGQSQIIDVGGTPHVALLEVDRTVYPQRTMARVSAWNGSAWAFKGSALNHSISSGETALSISIASDGVNPAVAWNEYNHSQNGNGYNYDTNPLVSVAQWNGSQWVALGSALNVNTANWAYDPSIAYLGGTFYVAWVERTQVGNNQLYVKAWNGSSWVLVGSGTLNHAPGSGWAFHPSLIADAASNSLYLGWVEQVALGQKAQVFISRYSGGSWTALGGALNVDAIQGSAQRVSIGVYNGQPVAAWGEVNLGGTRQVFVKQWSGSSWIQLLGAPVPDTTAPSTPAGLQATAVSPTQIGLAWSRASDTVGVTGYFVSRNGTRVATVTSTIAYQDTGLTPNTPYCYTVAAFDAAGNVSPQSASACTAVAVSLIGLSSSTVVGGASTTGNTVSLSGPAPSGGAVVTLSSNSPSATLPASVTVAAGASVSPGFTINTSAVTAGTPVTISATSAGFTVTTTLTLVPPTPSAVTLSPATVLGGTSTSSNTVTLSGPAPAGGAVVTLSSNNPAATVPASVTVAAGATVSPSFAINTTAVSVTTTVTISATYNGVTTPATLTVNPLAVSAVKLSPASVSGGNSTTQNTVTLTGPAPTGGAVVTLTSNNPAASVPASVTVAAGATTSPVFTITTTAVTAATNVTVSAVYGGITATSTLTVTVGTAPAASAVSLSPASVLGGNPTTQNTVSLTSPPPAGGAVVTLTSSNPAATVPASVTVAAGATTSPVFTITTTAVAATTNAVISATYGGSTVTSTLSVTSGSSSGPTLQLHGNAAEVSGVQNGAVVTPTVGPAGFSGTVKVNPGGSVNFVTPGDGVYFLNCCGNANNAYYQFTGAGVGTVFGASQGQITFNLTSRYSFAQRKAQATGQRYTFDVRDGNGNHLFDFLTQISAPLLTFTYAAEGVGTTYFVPSGQEDALFGAGVQMQVTIAWNGSVSQLYLNGNQVVSKPAANPAANWNASSVFDLGAFEYLTFGGYDSSDDVISGFTVGGLTPPSVSMTAPTGGALVSGTVAVTAAATAGLGVSSVQFQLDGSNLGAAVATAPYSTNWNTTSTSNGSHNLTAVVTDKIGSTATSSVISVTVNNSLSSPVVALSPSSVVGGKSTTLNTVTLPSPAPTGGAVVTLASNNAAATVPASVTVGAGATTSPVFTITTTAVTATTNVTISATYGGVTGTSTLTVNPPAPAAVTLSPATVIGGNTTTQNTVTLTGAAPTGGAVVTLASNNPAATVPASVTVAAGAPTSPVFSITTTAVTAATSVTISATYGGVTATGTLTVNPPAASAVTLSPASVLGGNSTTQNTVTLTGPAPTGGAVVTLASNNPAATVPASVTVAAAATTSSVFTITTTAVTATTGVTISATYGAITSTSTLTVTVGTAPAASAVSLSPASVLGGNPTTQNTVSLTGPAPAGGAVVMLTSGNLAATVPASVTVAAGATTSPVFTITTTAVTATTNAVISATYGGFTVTSTLSVTSGSSSGPSLLLRGNATEVGGLQNGALVTPTVGPAGFSGTVKVNPNGSLNFVTPGDGVYFLNCCGNANNAYYQFKGVGVGTVFGASQGQITFNLTSRYSFAQRKSQAAGQRYTFDVRDGNGNHLFDFLTQISAPYLIFTYAAEGVGTTYFVPSGQEDALFGAGVQMQVTIAWNGSVSQLYLNGNQVVSKPAANPAANWNASSVFDLGAYEYLTFGGYDSSDDVISGFTVAALTPPSVSVTVPASGASVSGTLAVTAAATAGLGVSSVQFKLDGSNLGTAVTTVPYSTNWNTTSTSNGSHNLTAVVTDKIGSTATSSAVSVTVNNTLSSPAISLSPSSVVGGKSTTLNTATLPSPAPTGGAVVTLTSNNPAATVPASVTVAAGATTSPVFTITTTAVAAATNVTISATYGGVTGTSTLTVNPPAPSAVTLSPASVVGGKSTTQNTVTLTGAAPTGGAVVTLTSNNPVAVVPASVTVAAGATTSPVFTITTTAVTAATSVTISATYGGVTATATLTVNPPAPSAVTLSPASVSGGNSTTQNTVTLTGPAPTGGAVVALASNNPAAVVPASITVAAGATTSPVFTITTTAVTATTSVTISATYGGITATSTLTVTLSAAPVASAVTLLPASVLGGNPTTQNTVTLTGPAPTGGAVVTVTSNNPAAVVPASVTVAAGATTSPVFTITTTAVAATTNAVISATYGGATATATLSVTSGSTSGPTLQMHGNATEVSGVQNGALVTPTVGPAGFSGTVKVSSGGSVNFSTTGNGVYFLSCCGNVSNAYYQFKGAGVGTVFGNSQGQITFNLTSRYSFAQRKTQATGQRYTFDVRDGNGNHLFDFLTQITAPYLTFTYAAGGMGTTYFVPSGQEDALFGAGVQVQVTIVWNGSSSQLFLNGNLVASKSAAGATGNWTASSTFDLGAYEYLTFGGYDSSDDTISEFTVK
jgi:hypothetical protein